MPAYIIGRLLGLNLPSKEKTTDFVVSAKSTIYKVILSLLLVTTLLWTSVFLYATFYYSYMPAISHQRPVFLQFRSCTQEKRLCSYPSANVSITANERILMYGQQYKVVFEMEMPESHANQNLGMFMVCVKLKDSNEQFLDSSCRSAMLHYKSSLFHTISTLIYVPFLLSGSTEEKQTVSVEIFSNFQENYHRPVTSVFVEIQSHFVEIYSARIKIHAHFTGIRYIMFHFPIISAFIGILSNLFFLSIVSILSWYKFTSSRLTNGYNHVGYDSTTRTEFQSQYEERRAMAKQKLLKERKKNSTEKPELEKIDDDDNSKSSITSSAEDIKPKDSKEQTVPLKEE